MSKHASDVVHNPRVSSGAREPRVKHCPFGVPEDTLCADRSHVLPFSRPIRSQRRDMARLALSRLMLRVFAFRS